MSDESKGRSNPRARAALRRPFAFVIPAKAGIQSGLHRLLRLLVDPIEPRSADVGPSGPRPHVPVRGAWESACGWEARWNAWLASPTGPMWRGDGEQPHRR